MVGSHVSPTQPLSPRPVKDNMCMRHWRENRGSQRAERHKALAIPARPRPRLSAVAQPAVVADDPLPREQRPLLDDAHIRAAVERFVHDTKEVVSALDSASAVVHSAQKRPRDAAGKFPPQTDSSLFYASCSTLCDQLVRTVAMGRMLIVHEQDFDDAVHGVSDLMLAVARGHPNTELLLHAALIVIGFSVGLPGELYCVAGRDTEQEWRVMQSLATMDIIVRMVHTMASDVAALANSSPPGPFNNSPLEIGTAAYLGEAETRCAYTRLDHDMHACSLSEPRRVSYRAVLARIHRVVGAMCHVLNENSMSLL
jgi:hypothetical protein